MTNWISCKERLPEEDEEVIVWVKSPMGPSVTICHRFNNPQGDGDMWSCFQTSDEDITHWMSIPEPPEAK